jgi:hypothetical protein
MKTTTTKNNLVTLPKETSSIPPQKIEIVIASHKENLWYLDCLREKGYKTTIYNTGPHGAFCFSLDDNMEMHGMREIQHTKLPNTDREAGQFLYHMVTQKENLADFTLFLQGDLGWRCCNHEKHLLGASSEAVEKLITWLDLSSESKADFLSYELFKPQYRQTNKVDEEIFEEVMKPLGAFRCPHAVAMGTNGGQFRVSKKKIQDLPSSYLSGLLNFSNQKPLSHRLEWSWGLVLDSSKCSFNTNTEIENTIPKTE